MPSAHSVFCVTLATAVTLSVLPASTTQAQVDTPIADPIPEKPEPADLALTLEEVITMPASSPVPAPTDPRLMRHARINFVGEVPDGSGRLFVPDLNGKLYLVKRGVAREYLDLGALVGYGADFWNHRGLGTGFGFVAFHPDFAHNGTFYTVHTEARDALTTRTPDWTQPFVFHHGVLTEWVADDPSASAFAGKHRELMRIGFQTQIHGFQEIGFNPTSWPGDDDYGLLYISAGDGGAGPGATTPQNLALPHGKILRIDPFGRNSANGKYGIPCDNPFADKPGVLGEIYAYGLRNPHRFSWDQQGKRTRMFVGNIGEHNIESIYEVKPGDNFGWTEREGPFVIKDVDPSCSVYPLPSNDASFGYTYPVAAYDHDPPATFPRCTDTGDAVIGGFVYRGRRVPELTGKYVFGDDVNGRLFYTVASEMRRGKKRATIHELALADAAGKPLTMQDLAGSPRVDLRFGRDDDGELYLLSKANGKIWKIKRARRLRSGCDPR